MSFLMVAYGGGINSTAMLIGLLERAIIPDVALFADTGAEKPETYEYIRLVSDRLFSITVVEKDSMYSSLEDECLRRRSLPSLAYGWRSCSDKWKQNPQRKYMNRHAKAKEVWTSGGKVTRAIGFSIEEDRRVKESTEPKYENWFPLIEWGWDRGDCAAAIQRAGLPIPVKSSCFFCPASTKKDIAWLSTEHPDLYDRALQMEQNADLITIKGLGRRFSWRDIRGPELETIEQSCMCYDGDSE